MPRTYFILLLIVSLGAIAAEALCISSLGAQMARTPPLAWPALPAYH